MKRLVSLAVATAAALAAAGVAHAHHSFAVFFDPEKSVKVTGKVTSFRFTNPHGTVAINVTKPDGKVEEWRAERGKRCLASDRSAARHRARSCRCR